ncbi:hypothetical protein WJX84_007988 [Apatococcus fuscideae]|uniref:BRCT domain-containing protein n=1 Tax=Apatococcus fuscideae TaxID=2026836 RepID=A0AAW1SRV7_9CHLO
MEPRRAAGDGLQSAGAGSEGTLPGGMLHILSLAQIMSYPAKCPMCRQYSRKCYTQPRSWALNGWTPPSALGAAWLANQNQPEELSQEKLVIRPASASPGYAGLQPLREQPMSALHNLHWSSPQVTPQRAQADPPSATPPPQQVHQSGATTCSSPSYDNIASPSGSLPQPSPAACPASNDRSSSRIQSRGTLRRLRTGVASPMSSIMVSHISPSLPNDDGGWHAARGGLARVAEAGQGHGLGPEAGAALAQQATGGGMRGKAGRGLKDGSGAGKADAEKLGARTPTLKRQPARDRHQAPGSRHPRKRPANPSRPSVTPPTVQRQGSLTLPAVPPAPVGNPPGHLKGWQEPSPTTPAAAELANPYSFELSQGAASSSDEEPIAAWGRKRPRLAQRPPALHKSPSHPPRPAVGAALQDARRVSHVDAVDCAASPTLRSNLRTGGRSAPGIGQRLQIQRETPTHGRHATLCHSAAAHEAVTVATESRGQHDLAEQAPGTDRVARAEADCLASSMGATILQLNQVHPESLHAQSERPIDSVVAVSELRSAKYLAARTLGCPILKPAWLHACCAAGARVEPDAVCMGQPARPWLQPLRGLRVCLIGQDGQQDFSVLLQLAGAELQPPPSQATAAHRKKGRGRPKKAESLQEPPEGSGLQATELRRFYAGFRKGQQELRVGEHVQLLKGPGEEQARIVKILALWAESPQNQAGVCFARCHRYLHPEEVAHLRQPVVETPAKSPSGTLVIAVGMIRSCSRQALALVALGTSAGLCISYFVTRRRAQRISRAIPLKNFSQCCHPMRAAASWDQAQHEPYVVVQTYERGGGGPFKRERVACNWGFKDAQGNLLPVHDSCEAEFQSGALEDAILEGDVIRQDGSWRTHKVLQKGTRVTVIRDLDQMPMDDAYNKSFPGFMPAWRAMWQAGNYNAEGQAFILRAPKAGRLVISRESSLDKVVAREHLLPSVCGYAA